MDWRSMVQPGCLPLTTPVSLDESLLKNGNKLGYTVLF